MQIKDLIIKNRSYRRFYEEINIAENDLIDCIDCARLSASARNAQSLKYIISTNKETNQVIFRHLAWAGYLKHWNGPEPGERPTAYIIMLNDITITDNYFCDPGIAVQSILLSATEKGFGGCIIASIQREMLVKELIIPDYLQIIQIVALGKPKEIVMLEEKKPNEDYKYWRDENEVHHVPKRKLDEIIIKRY